MEYELEFPDKSSFLEEFNFSKGINFKNKKL